MLLLHLIDLCLLLLHDLGQLQLVLELGAEAALRGGLGARVHHLLIALRVVAILDGGAVRVGLIAHVHAVIVSSDLIGDPKVILLLLHRILIHLDRGRARALSLVRDLDLTLADLDCVSRIGRSTLSSHLLLVGDGGQPLGGSVVVQMALGHAHVVALGENRIRATSYIDSACVSDGHRRVVSQLTLVHKLVDLGWGRPDDIHL